MSPCFTAYKCKGHFSMLDFSVKLRARKRKRRVGEEIASAARGSNPTCGAIVEFSRTCYFPALYFSSSVF